MKINSLNNISFGALYIEYNGKETKIDKKNYKKVIKKINLAPVQKKTIKNIINNENLTPSLIKKLEQSSTDIYIKPLPYSDVIDLKLYTDIDWFGKKVIPYDGRYNSKMQTYINPNSQGDFITALKISNFLERANDMDFNSDKNNKLVYNTIY